MSVVQEIYLQGSPVSEGIAIGNLFVLPKSFEDNVPEFFIGEDGVEKEIAKYRKAIEDSQADLSFAKISIEEQGSIEAAHIIQTHIQMLADPLMTTRVEEGIKTLKKNAAFVFTLVVREFEKKFITTKNIVFQQRVIDILDLSKRILGYLCERKLFDVSDIPKGSIVFTEELNPSDIAVIESSHVKAFVTRYGGGGSHAALIAKAKGIPYVSNINMKVLDEITIEQVLVDGKSGEVIFNPAETTIAKYKILKKEQKILLEAMNKGLSSITRTSDGYPIQVLANVGTLSDLDEMHEYDPKEVGLLRSEFLFLEKNISFLSEEEQIAVYSQVREKAKGLPLVIRLFDVGGDKKTDLFLEPVKESNPFLGCRGIRFLLKHPIVLRMQLRAIMRAFQGTNVKILLPLVSDVQEIQKAKKLMDEIQIELVEEGLIQPQVFSVGTMIEVPSIVFLCDVVIKEVDFLAIGTNDLVQYTLGMDRSDPSFREFFHLAHPSLIRMLNMILSEAKKNDTPVSICGEMASNPLLIPLFLGLGIRRFSCSPRYIPLVKKTIHQSSLLEALGLAKRALQTSCCAEIEKILASP